MKPKKTLQLPLAPCHMLLFSFANNSWQLERVVGGDVISWGAFIGT